MVTAYELRQLANHYTLSILLDKLKQVAAEGKYKYDTQEYIEYDDVQTLKELGFTVDEDYDTEPPGTRIKW